MFASTLLLGQVVVYNLLKKPQATDLKPQGSPDSRPRRLSINGSMDECLPLQRGESFMTTGSAVLIKQRSFMRRPSIGKTNSPKPNLESIVKETHENPTTETDPFWLDLEDKRYTLYPPNPDFKFPYKKFEGVMAASFTPLSEDSLGVNLTAIQKYSEYLVKQNVSGVFLNGTSGQSVCLTTKERKQILDTWLKTEAVPSKLQVIVHVGANSIVDVLDLAKHAAAYGDGIAGICVMAPSFFKPSGEKALARLLIQVAQSVPKIPFYYYHIPFMNGINVSVNDTLMLAKKFAPNIVGCKFTDSAFFDVTRMQSNGFNVLIGADDMLTYALAAGADGTIGIGYNFYGPQAIDIYNCWLVDAKEEAEKSQRRIGELMHVIKSTGNFNGACFYLFEKQSGISLGRVRYPLHALDEKGRQMIDAFVDNPEDPYFPRQR
jgi:N-acetylneuraminate lyase